MAKKNVFALDVTKENMVCPNCGNKKFIGIEYAYGIKERYDGVSEWMCDNEDCAMRFGRWCGKELKDHEVENRFCEGQAHHLATKI